MAKKEEKKLTVEINEDLFKKFKIQVVENGSTMKDTIENLITNYLVENGSLKKSDIRHFDDEEQN